MIYNCFDYTLLLRKNQARLQLLSILLEKIPGELYVKVSRGTRELGRGYLLFTKGRSTKDDQSHEENFFYVAAPLITHPLPRS